MGSCNSTSLKQAMFNKAYFHVLFIFSSSLTKHGVQVSTLRTPGVPYYKESDDEKMKIVVIIFGQYHFPSSVGLKALSRTGQNLQTISNSHKYCFKKLFSFLQRGNHNSYQIRHPGFGSGRAIHSGYKTNLLPG